MAGFGTLSPGEDFMTAEELAALQSGNALSKGGQMLAGMAMLPKRVIDAAAQAPAPGLRREDFTDIPANTAPDPKSAFGGIGVPFGRIGWQPGDELIGQSLESAANVMGGTSLSAPAGAVVGAGPARMRMIENVDLLKELANQRKARGWATGSSAPGWDFKRPDPPKESFARAVADAKAGWAADRDAAKLEYAREAPGNPMMSADDWAFIDDNIARGNPVLGAGAADKRAAAILALPSSESLALPSAPAIADLKRAGRIEEVDLSKARRTQPKMDWDRDREGRNSEPMFEGYGDLPVAVRREDGEYLVFDGHHRAVGALQNGEKAMKMHVVDAKAYAPDLAGRKPSPQKPQWGQAEDDLLRELSGPDWAAALSGDAVLPQGLFADVAAKYPDIKIDGSVGSSGYGVLSRIQVPPEMRGKGVATSAMNDIVSAADAQGIPLALSPSADWGASKSRLTEFYKRFGFMPNAGRSKDFAVRETMIRPRKGD